VEAILKQEQEKKLLAEPIKLPEFEFGGIKFGGSKEQDTPMQE